MPSFSAGCYMIKAWIVFPQFMKLKIEFEIIMKLDWNDWEDNESSIDEQDETIFIATKI